MDKTFIKTLLSWIDYVLCKYNGVIKKIQSYHADILFVCKDSGRTEVIIKGSASICEINTNKYYVNTLCLCIDNLNSEK